MPFLSGLIWEYHLDDDNLTTARTINAILANASLTDVYLTDSYLRNNDLSNANLYDADLSDPSLVNKTLANTDLYDAALSDAYLIRNNLTNADSNLTNLSEYDCESVRTATANFAVNANLLHITEINNGSIKEISSLTIISARSVVVVCASL